MQLNKILTIVILISTYFSAFAQINNAVVSGVVRHEISKELLPYVNVVVTDSEDSFLTGCVSLVRLF